MNYMIIVIKQSTIIHRMQAFKFSTLSQMSNFGRYKIIRDKSLLGFVQYPSHFPRRAIITAWKPLCTPFLIISFLQLAENSFVSYHTRGVG